MRRVKRRYLVVRRLGDKSASEILLKSIEEAFGVYGLTLTRLSKVYTRGEYEVIAVLREGVPLVRAANALFSFSSVIILRVAGTSRRARRIVDSMPSEATS